MKLVVFGLNHRTSPVSLRESWSVSAQSAKEALGSLARAVSPSEHLVLSTCNRTEFYSCIPAGFEPGAAGPSCADNACRPDEIVQRYASFFWGAARTARADAALQELPGPEHYYVYLEEDAVEHLFRVAGGLDSMILGESQILRQIKDAYALSTELGHSGKLFHKLFPAALRTGKHVRSETQIADGVISPGQAALKLARRHLGTLEGRTLVVVGSGKIATNTAIALRDEGINNFQVVNRSIERARELIRRLGCGCPAPLSTLEERLVDADVVISSTGATEPIIQASMLARVQARRGRRPLAIVDLAIPRDAETACGAIEGVGLFHIDDLNSVIQENVEQRHRHVPQAEMIVQRELTAFRRWMTYAKIDPVLKHIRDRFHQIGLGELQQFLDRLPAEHHDTVRQLTDSIVKKLLHFPIEKLKSLRDYDGFGEPDAQFLKRLFLSDLE